MKILITGITGFVGSHMADYCLEKGHEVHGTFRWRSNTSNLEHIARDDIALHQCDITDAHAVKDVIREVQPDYIFHLAAQSFVKASWTEPSQTFNTNVIGQINLLEAVRSISDYNPRIQIACSSEEYGKAECLPEPIKETEPLNPLSPYAVSKVAQDLLGFQYFKSYGMHIVRTRAFNHTGPRRGEVFVCSTFAKQIVEIEKGKRRVLKVGNLDAVRDFTDVRDVVRGYWLALEKGEPGEVYNICSGSRHALSMESVLQMLSDQSSSTRIEIKEDPSRLRPSDLPTLIGDATKFRKQTGWKPTYKMEDTMKDLLNYWRER